MEKPDQLGCVKLALAQFRNPNFTDEEVDAIAPTADVRVFNDNFDAMNMIHLQFEFSSGGERYDLMVDLVPDDDKGWVCFYDGTGPNECSYARFLEAPDGRGITTDFVDGPPR